MDGIESVTVGKHIIIYKLTGYTKNVLWLIEEGRTCSYILEYSNLIGLGHFTPENQ